MSKRILVPSMRCDELGEWLKKSTKMPYVDKSYTHLDETFRPGGKTYLKSDYEKYHLVKNDIDTKFQDNFYLKLYLNEMKMAKKLDEKMDLSHIEKWIDKYEADGSFGDVCNEEKHILISPNTHHYFCKDLFKRLIDDVSEDDMYCQYSNLDGKIEDIYNSDEDYQYVSILSPGDKKEFYQFCKDLTYS
jgi:hypothetical protein